MAGPLGSQSWTCKRVWGLPGESIQLRDGELWVNGSMFRKNMLQFLQVAIPVADLPGPGTLYWHRGRSEQSDSAWQSVQHLWATEASAASTEIVLQAGDELRWLYRQQWSSTGTEPALPSALVCQSVLDDYPINHGMPRNLVPVDDLLLTIGFASAEQETPSSNVASARVECLYRGHSYDVLCDFGSELTTEVAAGQAALWQAASRPQQVLKNPGQLMIGGWDGYAWARADSGEAFELPDRARPPDVTSFRIQALCGVIRIGSLQVHRDIYLRDNERDPSNGATPATVIGANQYYVLGDNLPASVDSRNGLGCIDRSQIIGQVQLPEPK
ncbi:MAG: hypothetical protein KF752_03685 [Pirellulaceae bacterium]|nr:hypothetical protein [Pirellulaceae bacterium]